jgi:hypothetical protein
VKDVRGGEVLLEIEPEELPLLVVKEMAQRAKIVGLEFGVSRPVRNSLMEAWRVQLEMIEIVIREVAFVGRVVHDQEQRREGQEQNQTSALGHGRTPLYRLGPLGESSEDEVLGRPDDRYSKTVCQAELIESTRTVQTRVLSGRSSLTIAL